MVHEKRTAYQGIKENKIRPTDMDKRSAKYQPSLRVDRITTVRVDTKTGNVVIHKISSISWIKEQMKDSGEMSEQGEKFIVFPKHSENRLKIIPVFVHCHNIKRTL